ncbi:hypothetical protein BDB00DRAFT_793244 [Zychaea mexicana]|uniref:uncharacterized protein n=1 Tax=Zychaea mexicana TaxID=64656 RepID=UPI0022FE1F72|nr:uncharacterized protein BDB00DRAFT_793244 [Zychaea mexicana]KAI9479510.1 hypothetical protein BDB00DRAFT_793244 [Zychaea mexicana]
MQPTNSPEQRMKVYDIVNPTGVVSFRRSDGREAAGLWARFAKIWNTKHADGSTIFYKFPQFLQAYHTTRKHAQDIRKTISRAKNTLKQVVYVEQRCNQAVSALKRVSYQQ